MAVNIYFDFDMTLAYRIMMWTDTVRELLLEECVVVKREDIRPFYTFNGYPWNRPDLSHEEFFKGKEWWQNSKDFLIEGLIEKGLTDEATARRVADKFPSRFADIRYWRLFSDTLPAVKKLKELGYSVNILSNHVPEAREIITKLGIIDEFDRVILSSEVGYEKPNEAIFKIAVYGRENDINVMVGDNFNADVKGAINAGMKAILVRESNSGNYKYYLKDLSGLDAMIEEVINNET